jgi:oligo-1,6-glucosidase
MKSIFQFLIFSTLLQLLSPQLKAQTNTSDLSKIDKKWWKEAIIYQLYPRSFQDSNGDGVGDLKGITQRLDYLQSLGIDAIWINPICASPNDDNGYDISDYKAIMKEMGTMADFDEMLAGMKKRNIKLIMDLVLNHSSDEHQWFVEAKKSRDNKYRNYYHWWPAEKGTPPKRYSIFDENSDAWRFEPNTNSYYLHYFSRKQPDLNWENSQLRQEMYDIMKFWLDKGVSGFRLDAFPFIAKDTNWPIMPADFTNEQFVRYYGADSKLHDYLREMNEALLSKYNEVYTVGEGGVIPFQKVMDFVDEDRKEINTLYHDEIGNIWGRDAFDVGPYQVGRNNVLGMKEIVSKWDKKMQDKGWNTVFFTNHDQSRAVSRYGNDSPEFREPSAKMLYTFLLTQRATPYIYNGDEIGMTNIRFKTVNEYNDLQTRNLYYQLLKISDAKAAEYLINQQELSRDNSRTPMQWNATKNAGFTTGNPWLTINKNYTTVNVEANIKDKNSILNYAKKLAKIRKENPIFVYGKLEIVDPTNPDVFAYTRELNGKKIIVLLNFTSKTTTISTPLLAQKTTQWIGNYPTPFQKELRPYESVILKVN